MNAETGFQLPNPVVMPGYRDGFQFQRTRCANFCTGVTGTVRVSDDEIEAIARKDGA